MISGEPLVSVGVPVFNGEDFLRDTLASLLSQTFENFEVVVSDNASSDRTETICREFASLDRRIRYFRQPRNFGAPENWNFVVRQARGKFFKWASASDICMPQYLDACVRPLIADEDLVLCFGKTTYIDEAGRSVAMRENDVEALDMRPSDRFLRVFLNLGMNNEQYGVIRREALLRTRLNRSYPHQDLVLMAELALLGKFKLLPETVLVRRVAAGHWTGLMSEDELNTLFWPDTKPEHPNLLLRRHLDYLRTALASPINRKERARAAALALRFAYWRKAQIARELIDFVRRPRPIAA